MNAFFSGGCTFTNLPVLLLIQELKFRQRHLLRFVGFGVGLKLPLALLQTLVYAHGFRVPRRCSGRFFGHRFSRSVAASLLSVGVFDGIFPSRNVNTSQPWTSTRTPSSRVPENTHSDTPLSPAMKCLGPLHLASENCSNTASTPLGLGVDRRRQCPGRPHPPKLQTRSR